MERMLFKTKTQEQYSFLYFMRILFNDTMNFFIE